jgi:hypothetical protein
MTAETAQERPVSGKRQTLGQTVGEKAEYVEMPEGREWKSESVTYEERALSFQ